MKAAVVTTVLLMPCDHHSLLLPPICIHIINCHIYHLEPLMYIRQYLIKHKAHDLTRGVREPEVRLECVGP